ncbi:VCBS repeat-containing protein [Paenibacillus sp. BC26]|uniref:FG-GAP repeat domain-containing protein n=1 Tax=Paenibacillus sp. BC26 TaxID=1881032 RepID=UPI000B8A010E|nr:VCBS repeat-containing protein [Paenibacillus sp. BC26]
MTTPTHYADWALPRCDQRLTGRSAGTGRITDPKVVAKWDNKEEGTTSAWTYDLNLDGYEELIVIESGLINVYDLNGNLLWQRQISGSVRSFCDFLGNGDDMNILLLEGGVRLVILSGKTGDVCWEYTLPLKNATAPARIAAGKLDPAVKGCQIALFGEFGLFFTFDNGYDVKEPLWKIHRGRHDLYYPPVVVVGDVKGTGVPSVLNVCHDHIEMYNIKTGELEYSAQGTDVRNYGFSGLFDVDGDGVDEVVIVNNCVEIHAWAADFKDNQFTMMWDNDYGYAKTEMHFPTTPVADVDNDGKAEIFTTTIDTDVTELTVRIIDISNGSEKYVIKDKKVIYAGDLNNDGLIETVFENPADNTIEICLIRDGTVTSLAAVSGNAVQYARQEYTTPSQNHSQYGGIDYCDLHFYAEDIDGDGHKEIMIYTGNGIEFVTLNADNSVTMKYVLNDGLQMEFMDFVYRPDLERYAVMCRHYNEIKLFDLSQAGQNLIFSIPVVLSKQLTAVTATNVEGYPCQLISADNKLLKPVTGTDGAIHFEVVNTFYSSHKYIQYSPGLPTGIVHLSVSPWDVNGDGIKEFVYVGPGALIELYDNDYNLLWRNYLGKYPQRGKIMSYTFGHYTSPEHYDILYVFTESEMHRNSMIMVNGLTGEVIWRLRSDGHDRGNGAIWGYMATHSIEEDGLDDMTYIASFFVAEVDGKEGKPLHEKQNLPGLLNCRWVGYGHCAMFDVDHCGEDEILLHGVQYVENGLLKRGNGGLWEHVWSSVKEDQGRGMFQGIAQDAQGKVYLGGIYEDLYFKCCDALTGEIVWSEPLGVLSTSTIAVADIDGDGEEEFVFTAANGFLYAIGVSGTFKFKTNLGFSTTQVILSDIDHDGGLEILLPAGGDLYVVK